MIITEAMGDFTRHYSDKGMKIRQVETGDIYDDAIDITPCPYTYEETNEPIDTDDEELTAEEAVFILLGGEPE